MTRVLGLLAAAVLVLLATPLAPPAAAATQTVMMQDYAFTPASLTVRAGDTVTWMQHDTAPHDVVTTSAPVAFHSPQLSPGQSWSYTFRTPGTYAYYCSVHPDMRAQVTVLPAATTAPQPARTATPTTKAKQPTATTRTGAAGVPPPGATTPSSTAGAAAPDAAQTPPAAADQPRAPVAQPAASTSTTTLDPMLLVAGLVTAVAIGCLLLLTSRRA
jgi:plastocyanin